MKRLFSIFIILFICRGIGAEWLQDSIINDRNARCRTGYNVARGIAADGNNIYAVWTEGWYNIFLRAKLGGNWTNSEKISVGSPGGIYGISAYPAIAVRNGEVYVVWEDYRTRDFEIFYRKFSGGWGSPIPLSGDPAESRVPVITVTDGGKIFLIWQDERTGTYEIYSKIYSNGTWGATEKLSSNTLYAGFPTVTHYGETVYAVWEEIENNGYELYTSTYSGGNWSNAQRITNSEGMSQNPSICADPYGALHLIWVDDVNGNFIIYYSKFDGVNWTTSIPISDNPGEALYPQITSDPFGDIHLVWSDNREGSYEIFYKRFFDWQWSNDTILSHKEKLSTSPHITCTTDGSVHVIWYDWMEDPVFTSPHIRYRRFDPDSDSVFSSIKKEVTNDGVRISADVSQTDLRLFRLASPYPISVECQKIEGNRCIWFEPLVPGEYEYILQSRNGTEVCYSKTILVNIPQKGECWEVSISPNPFTTSTTIRLILPSKGQSAKGIVQDTKGIELKIYDLSGRLVKDFSLGTGHWALGTAVSWVGSNNRGKMVTPGVYFIKLSSKNHTITQKIIKL